MTGASDDDPAGIGTYIQTGAQFGYLQLWIALLSFPFMTVIQEMCGRIGLVTGQGLAAVIRNNYARPVLVFVIAIQVVTNTINIGADLSAMAESAQLLWHVPYSLLLALTTFITTALIVLVPYRNYATYLKFLGLTLLTYVISAFTVHVDWRQVLTATFIPHFQWDKGFILTLIAVFGVTISPYEFFWQSNEEVEDLVEHRAMLGGDHHGYVELGVSLQSPHDWRQLHCLGPGSKHHHHPGEAVPPVCHATTRSQAAVHFPVPVA